MADERTLAVSVPQPGVIRLELDGCPAEDLVYEGPVDNILLTSVDNLLKRHSIDRSALAAVRVGEGIDKNSSLARIVESFASAVKVGRKA